MKKKAIIVTAFLNYDYNIRIKYLRDYLESHDYSCRILSSNYDHRNKQIYKTDIKGVDLLDVPEYKKNLSLARIYSHYVFAKKCEKYITDSVPDLIYAIVPPNYMVSRIISAKQQTQAKVIFEVEDLWPESLPIPNILKKIFNPFFYFWKLPRDKSLFKADYVVFECDLFKGLLTNNVKFDCGYKKIYLTKDNTYKIGNYIYQNDSLIYLYIGSVNNLIDIYLIIKVLLETQKYKSTELYIIGKGEKLDYLLGLCELNNINVVLFGAIYDDKEKEKIIQKSHFGLNIMKKSVVVGATMKSLEYFYFGLPVLNNIQGDTCNILDNNECGINIYNNDIESVVKKIIGTVEDKEKYLQYRNNSRAVYDNLFSPQAFQNSFEEVSKFVNI